MAAVAALGIFAFTNSVVQAAPVRSKASASAVAKRKAAAKAAEGKAAQLAAEEAAERAAADAARARAQWGVLSEISDGDYDAKGTLVTVRRDDGGNRVTITIWRSIARLSYSFRRDPATGGLSYDYQDSWNSAHYDARVDSGGSVEAVMKNETSWPVLKRDASGVINFAYVPGKKMPLGPVAAGSSAAVKAASLIAAGKLSAVGEPLDALTAGRREESLDSSAVPPAIGVPSMATLQAAEGLNLFRKLKGDWWNGVVKWSFVPASGGVTLEGSSAGSPASQRKFELKEGQLLLDRSPGVPLANGAYFPKRGYAIVRKDEDSFSVTAGKLKGGSFIASRDQGLAYLGEYKRMTPAMAEAMRLQIKQYELAQAELAAKRAQEKASSGNSGWLGGLIMGSVAAAAGGDAGMVMGAAMKGVEMTTDNQMSRNVLAGKGDEMIQSSIDLQNQKAELERLRVAAEEETRRREAGARSPAAVAVTDRPADHNAAQRMAGATKPAASSSDMVRYSFCTDERTDRSSGRIREVIFYSSIGTIRPGADGGITFPKGFADYVDTQTPLERHVMSENCPLFESVARAEQDLAIKRQIERAGIRDFVFLPNFVPR